MNTIYTMRIMRMPHANDINLDLPLPGYESARTGTMGLDLIDAVAVFIARAEARALLWAAGEIDLHTAVDELWADAVRDGTTAATRKTTTS
jgi:hypothetical protein